MKQTNTYIQIRQAGTYYLDNIRMYRTYQDTVFVGGFEMDMAYRYGYNTQERVDEIAGKGNHYTAEFWEYSPRLGRRWNRDPITYPWQSPYATNNNNPIYFLDPSGLEGEDPQDGDNSDNNVKTYEEITVIGTKRNSPINSNKIKNVSTEGRNDQPNLFRRVLDRIGNFFNKVGDFLNQRKVNYSHYDDKFKNPYVTEDGINIVSEDGQGAENHRSIRTPETINYDMLFGLLKGVYRGSRVTQTWLDKAKKVDTSVDLFNKAEETVSDKMRSGSKTTGTGDMSGSGYGKLRPYANRDTVWRTETEQWWLYKKDTIIWDIDKNGNTRQPKFKTYHNHE